MNLLHLVNAIPALPTVLIASAPPRLMPLRHLTRPPTLNLLSHTHQHCRAVLSVRVIPAILQNEELSGACRILPYALLLSTIAKRVQSSFRRTRVAGIDLPLVDACLWRWIRRRSGLD